MEIKATNAVIKAVENVNAEATSQTVPIFQVPPGAYPIAYGARVKIAFAGLTYPTVKLGEGTILDGLIPKQPINKIGDLKSGYSRDSHSFCPTMTGTAQGTEDNRALIATFESSSGNLSSLTAGEIEFYLVYID